MKLSSLLYYLSLPLALVGGNFLGKNLLVAIPIISVSAILLVSSIVIDTRSNWTKWVLTKKDVSEVRSILNPMLGLRSDHNVISDHYERENIRTGKVQFKRVVK